MAPKFSLIAAACENMGMGIKGNLPWRLKHELQYFNRMTTHVEDLSKKNVVIMGRRTYFGIPENKRPLPKRINIVLSKTSSPADYQSDVIVCGSLTEALNLLQTPEYTQKIENIWIVGGNTVYHEAMKSNYCHRIYFTEIKAHFECDAFFPEIGSDFKLVENDHDIPTGIQEENGIKYEYKIYEKCT